MGVSEWTKKGVELEGAEHQIGGCHGHMNEELHVSLIRIVGDRYIGQMDARCGLAFGYIEITRGQP